MAASDKNHDYFHIISSFLNERYKSVDAKPYNFSIWEVQDHDREELLPLLDSYLNNRIRLLTIQLGENVSWSASFYQDFVSLLQYIKNKTSARIIVIGDFWDGGGPRDIDKQKAAALLGIEYVSLMGLSRNSEYYCRIGTTVYDKDGNAHTVTHEGVSKHPGDKGMLEIANLVIKQILSDPNSLGEK